MGLKNILRGFLFASLIDLWWMSISLTAIFGFLYYYYPKKFIFLFLAIICFASTFIFNYFSNTTAYKQQEANKIQFRKDPKKYTSNFFTGIIISIFFFLAGLIIEIINLLNHSSSERIYDYISIAILFLLAIIFFPIWIRNYSQMKNKISSQN